MLLVEDPGWFSIGSKNHGSGGRLVFVWDGVLLDRLFSNWMVVSFNE